MSDAAAVVWLEEAPADGEAARALEGWARARGVRLVAPEPSAEEPRVDLSLADRAEEDIEAARDAINALDGDAAERALTRAERLLRDHPELPSAAWLRAEVHRTWSTRWQRLEPRDEGRARAAWEEAHALDGGRVAGVGESGSAPRERVKVTIIVAGARRASVDLDGVALERVTRDARGLVFEADVAPAEHQLVVRSGARLLHASWVPVAGGGAPPVLVTADDRSACTEGALDGVRREAGRVAAVGVDCPRWVAAIAGARAGSVLVARCERDTCGPLLEWRTERLVSEGPPQPRSPAGGFPAWATWALAGLGAATATSIALIATGAFERRAIEPRFIVGGARQE